MPSHRLAALAVGGALLALPAAAEMRIELKDGRVFVLPFEQDDIAGLAFDGVPADPRAAIRLERSGGTAAAAAPPAGPAPVAVAQGGRLLRVGPGLPLPVPSAAAAVARDGDTVEIVAATYRGDVARWPQSNLTIRGVGGRPHIDADGGGYGGKAAWVVSGRDVLIENIELSNSSVADHNGAAIRAEGANLTLRGLYVHDNEMGILTAGDFAGEILIEGSEFTRNSVDHERYGIQPGHNIYVSGADRFTLRGSWVHDAAGGHNVKSRARENLIAYNRIEDGAQGSASYQIDIADAAPTIILGNLVRQGPQADNWVVISLASEGRAAPRASTWLVNNTIVNDRGNGVFVANRSDDPVILVNNIMAGRGEPHAGPVQVKSGLAGSDPRFADAAASDYRLLPGSPAIDAGIQPGRVRGMGLTPELEYVHPAGTRPRAIRGGAIDLGAVEAEG
ncbi:right-handed parallel beta-helix repeat-containing protein [Geminicoccaceae bacterium 1502E]|nr:right-handed parallel beta-helix repeat-containing protein [Geminicoccaceae bacterium 1502E]